MIECDRCAAVVADALEPGACDIPACPWRTLADDPSLEYSATEPVNGREPEPKEDTHDPQRIRRQ